MKRALIILLMLLIPLHTTWAAVSYMDNLVEAPESVPVFTAGKQVQASTLSASSTVRYDKSCCPGCHMFCHFAAVAPSYLLVAPIQPVPLLCDMACLATAYQSHIPDGPTRPNWTTAS